MTSKTRAVKSRQTTDFTISLGSTLQQMRKEMGLTLEAASNATGVSQSYLSRLESGKVDPPIGFVSRLLIAYGYRLSHLVYWLEKGQ